MTANGAGSPARLVDGAVARVALYYAALAAVAWLAWRLVPSALVAGAAPGIVDDVARLPLGAAAQRPGRGVSVATVAIAMFGAVLLALPVALVYVRTRAVRGYQQSVVQTLVVLPMVVAGVVVLVKDSLALAFGLAGIVAAVRFRTALDDSKDAVYVFLAVALGLAAAVDLPAAAALSVCFNIVVLLVWVTDFGHAPAHLDGRVADRRLRRAMEQMSRTGTFVARMDDEVFQGMTAEQLQAVADRAWRRARRNDPQAPDREGRRESLLRVRTASVEEARRAVEPALDARVKRWRYGGVVHEADGMHVVEYVVLLRREEPPDALTAALCGELAPHVVHAELD